MGGDKVDVVVIKPPLTKRNLKAPPLKELLGTNSFISGP
jgi:hypothetical protein